MLFNTVVAAVAGVLAVVPSALATITIKGPSADSYWVQNANNQIFWEYTQGDPNPISILVTNPNKTFLNGPFSIAEHVDLSNKSFTVTNVTLNVHPGYVVSFVNGSNSSQVYAQSAPFDVKPSGTELTTITATAPQATATSPSGTGTRNGTATSSGAAGSATSGSSNSNGARGTLSSVGPMLGGSVVAAVLGALATL